jgi:N-acetylmuramoyl-L-alanine amidase
MAEYTVKQGDHLSKIASNYGFRDYRLIWDHPQNAELKKKRQNPNVLYPGDVLFVPEQEMKEIPAATEKRHQYQVQAKPLALRLEIRYANNKPMAGVECELQIEGTIYPLTADEKGRIEHDISPDAESGELKIKHPDIAFPEIPLQIGHLDPIEEVSGWKARLNNLGYDAGTVDDLETAPLRSAIEEFQCDYFKDVNQVDGKCGPKTQAKLKEVHGC